MYILTILSTYNFILISSSPFSYHIRWLYNGVTVGGVTAIRPEQYREMNGYSNQFEGWGGEDDDFKLRLVDPACTYMYMHKYIFTYRYY